MTTRFNRTAMVVGALALASASAHATLTSFFEDNSATNPTGAIGSPVIDQDVKDKIAAFKAPLTTLSSFELEGATPFNATTGPATPVTLGGSWKLCGVGRPCPGASSAGRYNTTGLLSTPMTTAGTWIETTSPTAVSTFSMTFGEALTALAFFGTDFYDFAGVVSYELFDANGNEVEDGGAGRTIPVRNNQDGALLFYGLYTTTEFTKVVFTVTQTSTDPDAYDFLGFDSILVGRLSTTPPNPTPEPMSLALTGLGLLGLWATRRKRPGI